MTHSALSGNLREEGGKRNAARRGENLGNKKGQHFYHMCCIAQHMACEQSNFEKIDYCIYLHSATLFLKGEQ